MQSSNCKDTFIVKVMKIDTPDAEIVDLKGEENYCFDIESTLLRVLVQIQVWITIGTVWVEMKNWK